MSVPLFPLFPELLLLLHLQDDMCRKHQVSLYFQLSEIMFGWGTQQFSVWNPLIWFSMMKVVPAGQMHARGHAQWRPLCSLFFADVIMSAFSPLFMWALFGWVRAAPVCLLSLWPASTESPPLGCVHSTSAEVLLVSSLLFLDESSVFGKYLHSGKFSQDVHNVQNMQTIKSKPPLRLLVVLAISNKFLHTMNSCYSVHQIKYSWLRHEHKWATVRKEICMWIQVLTIFLSLQQLVSWLTSELWAKFEWRLFRFWEILITNKQTGSKHDICC